MHAGTSNWFHYNNTFKMCGTVINGESHVKIIEKKWYFAILNIVRKPFWSYLYNVSTYQLSLLYALHIKVLQ